MVGTLVDTVDRKLLLALLQDSRQSITALAKRANISRDVAAYRLNRLHKQGIIRDFITEIDAEKLGHHWALFFVTIKASAEQEFIAFINGLDYISWAATHLGRWSLGMAIFGKSNAEIEERFQNISARFSEHITGHEFAFYKNTQFFYEKFFSEKPQPITKSKEVHTIDKHDKTILRHLAKNSRISCVDLARNVPLTAPAIATRIKRMKKSGYIRKYTVYLNVFKMGFYQFIFYIKNKNLGERQKLFSYLANHPKVSMLLDYVGDPFIEFGVFVDDPYETRAILQEIRESFPDNELVDFFLAQEDFISYGVPACVFE